MVKQVAFLTLVLFVELSSAQDKIYLLKEQRDGKILEINKEKIKYQNPLNPGPVYSVGTSKVFIVFNAFGGFIVLNPLDSNEEHSKKLAEGFINYNKVVNTDFDRIITLQKKELACVINKEDESSVYINVNDVEVKIDKTNIAAIIYKNGQHKLFGEINAAAEALASVQDKYLIRSSKTVSVTNNAKSTPTKPVDSKPIPKTPTNSDVATSKVIPEKVAIVTQSPTAPKKEVIMPTTATLNITSSKGSSIRALLNDSLIGELKPSTTKKIPIKKGAYKLVLDDKQGNVVSNDIIVEEQQFGKDIVYAFPEIDYVAIKNAEIKRKKAELDSIEAIKKQASEIEKEKQKEAKAYQNNVLSVFQDTLTSLTNTIIKTRESLEGTMSNIKNGSLEFTPDFVNQYNQFVNLKSTYLASKKSFIDSANAYYLKEVSDKYVLMNKTNETKFNEKVGEYIQNVNSGKSPSSVNMIIALKKGRVADLPFYIKKDSINDYKIENDILIYYTLRNKLSPSVINYLIQNGADVDYFGKRFSDNNKAFETPLAIACINGDESVVKLFANAKASFTPPNSTVKEKKSNLKYLLPKISNQKVIDVLKTSNYDLNDGTEDIKKALEEINKNMIKINGGTFTMGCTQEQQVDCVDAERPSIETKINTFYLSKYEVTRSIWLAVMDDDDPGEFKDCKECPIDRVTYDTVIAFIKKLNKVTGKNFRLPTEAEWEFAARGGNEKKKNNKYAGSDNADDVAVTRENSTGKPSIIGKKLPNELNLYDMSGNISEWCSDWYSETYYSKSTKDNPKGPENGFKKVVRGGAWNLSLWSSRVSRRLGIEPNLTNNGVGFRLAMSE